MDSASATSYDEKPWAKEVMRVIARGVEENREWIGVDWVQKDASGRSDRELRMLDYACGPGNIASVGGVEFTLAVQSLWLTELRRLSSPMSARCVGSTWPRGW